MRRGIWIEVKIYFNKKLSQIHGHISLFLLIFLLSQLVSLFFLLHSSAFFFFFPHSSLSFFSRSTHSTLSLHYTYAHQQNKGVHTTAMHCATCGLYLCYPTCKIAICLSHISATSTLYFFCFTSLPLLLLLTRHLPFFYFSTQINIINSYFNDANCLTSVFATGLQQEKSLC